MASIREQQTIQAQKRNSLKLNPTTKLYFTWTGENEHCSRREKAVPVGQGVDEFFAEIMMSICN